MATDLDSSGTKFFTRELAISVVLRLGILVSGTVILFGITLEWAFPNLSRSGVSELLSPLTSGSLIQESTVPRAWSEFSAGILRWDPAVFISIGILILILLPIIRVLLTVVLFVLEGDWIYVTITLFVLSVLISSLYLGGSIL